MSTVPAVCPNCAQIVQVDAETLPEIYTCPHCGAQLTHQRNGAVITFSIKHEEPKEPEAVAALLRQAEEQEDPRKKYKLLEQALALNPDSYRVNLALLELGKLYERDKRPGDYRVIKGYLLNIFEEPQNHPEAEYQDMLRELVEDPQVLRTLALAPDPERFWAEYFGELSDTYVNIFIRGRSGISKFAFGLPRSTKDIAHGTANVLREMMRRVAEERQMEAVHRQQLRQAMRSTYAHLFPEFEGLLNDA